MVWTDFQRSMTAPRRLGLWDPWQELTRMQEEMSRLLGGFTSPVSGRRMPPVRVFTDERGAHLTALLPGLAAENVDISVEGDTLTIRGERPEPELGDGESWVMRERRTGKFARTLSFPFSIDAANVQARMKHGVLEIDVPRSPEELPKKIEVRAD